MKKLIVLLALLCTTVAFAGDKYDTSWVLNVTGDDGISRQFKPVVKCDELVYGTTTRKRSEEEIRALLENILKPDVPDTGDWVISGSGIIMWSEGGEDYEEKYAKEFLYEEIPLVKEICSLTWEYIEEEE